MLMQTTTLKTSALIGYPVCLQLSVGEMDGDLVGEKVGAIDGGEVPFTTDVSTKKVSPPVGISRGIL